MKLTILTVNDGEHVIHDIDQETVLPLLEAFLNQDVRVIALQFDEAMCYFQKRNIIALTVE